MKDKDIQSKTLQLEILKAERMNQEERFRHEKEAMQMQHDHETKMKNNKSDKLERILNDLLIILKKNKESTYLGSTFNKKSPRTQIHLDIDQTTGSMDISTDNDEVRESTEDCLTKTE